MTTIYLEQNQVPPILRGGYAGKKYRAEICETFTIPSDAGLWSGGSRDTYRLVSLDTGESVAAVNHNASPWDKRREEISGNLRPGVAIVKHCIFCGKDMGLTFYIHPDNAQKLLPAPADEITGHRKTVLMATRNFKSSYGGMDRYDMAKRECQYQTACKRFGLENPGEFPSRAQWDQAKAELIATGHLNKAGAITTKGRNAI